VERKDSVDKHLSRILAKGGRRLEAADERQQIEDERLRLQNEWVAAWLPMYHQPDAAAIRRLAAYLVERGVGDRWPEIRANREAAPIAQFIRHGTTCEWAGERSPHLAFGDDGREVGDREMLVLDLLETASDPNEPAGTLEEQIQRIENGPLTGIAGLNIGFGNIAGYLEERLKHGGELPPEPEPTKPAQVAVVDATEPAADDDKPVEHDVNLSNWALALSETGWVLFGKHREQWRERGKVELSRGRVDALARALVKREGRISKDEAIQALKSADHHRKNGRWIFNSVCKPARRDLARDIQRSIERVSTHRVKVSNPVLWCAEDDCWRTAIEVGYAVRMDNHKLAFRKASEIDDD
jgi:hypothetical protein